MGGKAETTGKEKWKSDGGAVGGFQSQQWLMGIFLPSAVNTHLCYIKEGGGGGVAWQLVSAR